MYFSTLLQINVIQIVSLLIGPSVIYVSARRLPYDNNARMTYVFRELDVRPA